MKCHCRDYPAIQSFSQAHNSLTFGRYYTNQSRVERFIVCNNWHSFKFCLGHYHPVKRISVVNGETASMDGGDGEFDEFGLSQKLLIFCNNLLGFGQFTNPVFSGYFPSRDTTDENAILWVSNN
jgi:hypothetical protein